MKFENGLRNHPQFNLDDARPRGPTFLVRPAREPELEAPNNMELVYALEEYGCFPELGDNCYVLSHNKGGSVNVPYGATFDQWMQFAKQLRQVHE